jgi:uncharacterized DUF497 family protein
VVVVIKPHAELRMRDRGISEGQVRKVFQDPRDVISVRYGRWAAYCEVDGRRLVVIYEKRDETIEVITALWVDQRRLRTLGFAGI